MEFKGTKGKWHVLKIDLSDYKSISIGSPINNKVICHMVLGGAINNTDEYNALLMSKAPEMLDCLQMHMDGLNLSNIEFYEKYNFNVSLIYEKTEQLIKEATEL